MQTISNLRMRLRRSGHWIAGTLLLALAAAAGMGFDRLVPQLSGGLRTAKSRVGWYLTSGQWHADARTLVAAATYVLTPDNELLPTATVATNHQVADASIPSAPAAGANCTHPGDPS